MDNQESIIKLLKEVGAIVNGHFVYASGKHGEIYINKDAIYLYPQKLYWLCLLIAGHFSSVDVDVVVGPVLGGIPLSQWVAYHLSEINGRGGKEALAVYAEKTEDKNGFIFNRGYDKVIAGKRVLIVEDIITTGNSARKVIKATHSAGGIVIGLGALVNRGGAKINDFCGISNFFSLVDLKLNSWDESDCPLCLKRVPIDNKIGHGRAL
ncbi:MAG: Orotate phosphoribosyltransferase [Parcubacteria group bacterium GW2011_GWC1_38_17]|nr:MAG: Orotate phosphoribosyltransferase [Parcubacteria group bacterium GW2011_GWC1_38_17]